MGIWIWVLLSGIAGMVVGYMVAACSRRDKPIGTLREDHSDPTEAPYLFLELEPGGLEKIHRCGTVTFKVKIEDYISGKEHDNV